MERPNWYNREKNWKIETFEKIIDNDGIELSKDNLYIGMGFKIQNVCDRAIIKSFNNNMFYFESNYVWGGLKFDEDKITCLYMLYR